MHVSETLENNFLKMCILNITSEKTAFLKETKISDVSFSH